MTALSMCDAGVSRPSHELIARKYEHSTVSYAPKE